MAKAKRPAPAKKVASKKVATTGSDQDFEIVTPDMLRSGEVAPSSFDMHINGKAIYIDGNEVDNG